LQTEAGGIVGSQIEAANEGVVGDGEVGTVEDVELAVGFDDVVADDEVAGVVDHEALADLIGGLSLKVNAEILFEEDIGSGFVVGILPGLEAVDVRIDIFFLVEGDIVDIVAADDVAGAEEADAIGVGIGGSGGPFGVVLDGSPDFVAFDEVVAAVNLDAVHGVAFEAVVTDDVVGGAIFSADGGEDADAAAGGVVDVIVFDKVVGADDVDAVAGPTVGGVGDVEAADSDVRGVVEDETVHGAAAVRLKSDGGIGRARPGNGDSFRVIAGEDDDGIAGDHGIGGFLDGAPRFGSGGAGVGIGAGGGDVVGGRAGCVRG